jgi:hypothetical protein
VIKKPRGQGGHSPLWAAGPEKMVIIIMGFIIVINYRVAILMEFP